MAWVAGVGVAEVRNRSDGLKRFLRGRRILVVLLAILDALLHQFLGRIREITIRTDGTKKGSCDSREAI